MYDCRGRGWFKRITEDDGPLEQVPCKGCRSCGGPRVVVEEPKEKDLTAGEDKTWDVEKM